MRLWAIDVRTADGEIVYADRLRADGCQILRGLVRQINEVFHESIGLPATGGVQRFEEDALAPLDIDGPRVRPA